MPLVASRTLCRLQSTPQKWVFPAHVVAGRRLGGYRHISAQSTPFAESTRIDIGGQSTSVSSPDASFEVLGSPYSLLSIALSPSQPLYTRRGTLIGLNSTDPDSTISTLRILNPTRRIPLGIPFLYQKITSTTPTSLLIAPKSPITSFAILQLDGTTDWQISQRKALVAFTGSTLHLNPTINQSLSLAHWGNTQVTGRGLIALAGLGQIFTLTLQKGETYMAHPANILAYTTTQTPKPSPFRFKSSNIKLSIPLSLGNWFPSSNFTRTVKTSDLYRLISRWALGVRTWSRRTIWGDRLFLKFEGPTTILLQSRGGNLREILSAREINEIADSPAGGIDDALYDLRKSPSSSLEQSNRLDLKRTGVMGALSSAATAAETNSHRSKGAELDEKDTKLRVKGVEDGKVRFEATSKS